MSEIIKECPRCCGQGILQEELDYYDGEIRHYVQCYQCGLHGVLFRKPRRASKKALEANKEDAVHAWNQLQNERR